MEPEELGNIYNGKMIDPVGFNAVLPPELFYIKSGRIGMTNIVFTSLTENNPMRDAMLLDTVLASHLDHRTGRFLADFLVSRYGTSIPVTAINKIKDSEEVEDDVAVKKLMEAMGMLDQNPEEVKKDPNKKRTTKRKEENEDTGNK